jgi:hypothetical protein
MFGISFMSAQSILTDILNMCHFATKFMPHLLNEKQKEIHGNTCPAVPCPPTETLLSFLRTEDGFRRKET